VDARLDLRDIAICSVDPPGCTDIDDALHWKALDDGNYEVNAFDIGSFFNGGGRGRGVASILATSPGSLGTE
jgi:hypothetical protein